MEEFKVPCFTIQCQSLHTSIWYDVNPVVPVTQSPKTQICFVICP